MRLLFVWNYRVFAIAALAGNEPCAALLGELACCGNYHPALLSRIFDVIGHGSTLRLWGLFYNRPHKQSQVAARNAVEKIKMAIRGQCGGYFSRRILSNSFRTLNPAELALHFARFTAERSCDNLARTRCADNEPAIGEIPMRA